MRMKTLCLLGAALWALTLNAPAQAQASPDDAPAKAELARDPWEIGAFLQGGLGTNDRDGFDFLSAGVRLGKVITDQHLPGILRGQFEYAGEIMPYWQSFTPAPHSALTEYEYQGQIGYAVLPYGGGTYT